MTTKAHDVQAALADALLDDATLAALLAGEKVYSHGTVAPEAPADYVVLGATSERETHPRFQRDGDAEGTVQLDIYATDQMAGLAIYAECERLLHRTKLPLASGAMLRGRLSLTTTLPDPLGVHLVAHYRTLAR